MEIEASEIKRRSLLALKGQKIKSMLWIGAVALSCFLSIFIAEIFKNILKEENLLTAPLSVVVFVSLFYETLFYALLWHYEKVSLKEMKRPSPIKVLVLNLRLSFRLFLYGLAFFATPSIFWILSTAFKKGLIPSFSPILVFTLDALVVILILVFLLLYIVFSMRYFLSAFLLMEGEEEKTRKIIKKSTKLMKSERENTALFFLSLTMYLIPSLLILPIFYFAPKALASICTYAKYLIEKSRMSDGALPYNF